MAGGVLEFRSPGGTVTRFQSLDEMQKLLDRMTAEVAAAAADPTLPSGGFRVRYNGKGL
jgi:hypothetical protein